MKKASQTNFVRWILQPSSWISLSAVVVSVGTFFLVYANPGEVMVTLPSEVGLRLKLCDGKPCNLELLAPVVFTNTGAPRKRRHVISVLAELRSDRASTPIIFKWKSEWHFVGYLEFNKKYPGRGEPDVEDYIEYIGRAMPFVIDGGESATKILKLEHKTLDAGSLRSFDLTIKAVTEKGVSKGMSHYECHQDITAEQFDWCESIKIL